MNNLVGYVQEQGGALIHELVQYFDHGTPTGDLALSPNVILWTGVSEAFTKLFNESLPYLEMHRAAPGSIGFFSDALGIPSLPIITADEWKNKIEFTEPHWLPTVYFLKEANGQGTAKTAPINPADVHVSG